MCTPARSSGNTRFLSDVAKGVITGLGAQGYEFALTTAMDRVIQHKG